ncbi:hypothetical protein D6D12_04179 [Aureobasidium pullulans]|uniref:BZIP domain-containing protein n=1 Tax=Aureobasidium pullulans TaxID=5580 RepID=A0AB74JVQ1_AURPU|nr:hypothetical protein D6D12_04179 [Aureobasidium pullulans]THX45488.1 hypothetical protein D6D11_07355 [Aureobasidium pullulans]THX90969.1 hypothetical protein D6D08_03542 [Aureobasidium pullulans]
MDRPEAATGVQKAREDATDNKERRKIQLRLAQARLRQRKADALKDANSEVELLRKQLAEAKDTIARLSPPKHSPDADEMVTSEATLHPTTAETRTRSKDNFGLGDPTNIDGLVVGNHALNQPMSPATLDSFFPGASDDLLDMGTPESFAFPSFNNMAKRTLPQHAMPRFTNHESTQAWPSAEGTSGGVGTWGYTFTYDEDASRAPPSIFPQSPQSPRMQLVRQPTPPSPTPLRGLSFAKRLWRRCAEMTIRILSDTKKHQALIERAFGNYFGHFSPSTVIRALQMALKADSFATLEYQNYPNFHFSQQPLMPHKTNSEGLVDFGNVDPAQDPYMTPRDIENYFVWNGQYNKTMDSNGNIVTLPCHFDFQGKRWILEENKLVHTLMHYSVCLGQGPAILASQVLIATFQSMQRVSSHV